ncbi:hypothetical protein B9Z55_017236 [Caenorhabditis nigoni]|uniref:Acyltransferase 3 domain-containing protein n=1 Tax=Caenorhabditis nigoni TaxID=1611254 RepID=A0A2G5T8M5_9PELO|nr:hypothetical protein B9Z55_017236 [Caenorhabditis nigoni]
MVHLYLGDFLWENNNRYSVASLFLVTNQLVIHDQADYFNELIVVSLITLTGFSAFALVLEQFAFNFMLLRLWQFSAGFMALFWNKIEVQNLPKDKDEYKNVEYPVSKSDVFTVALSILGFCIFPNNIDVLWLRPAVTMATAFIIAAESSDSQILSSKLLAYIGGISYVLYLVHWPIIAIFQPYTVQNYVFVIVTTFLSSILLHQIFEEKYLKLDRKMLISFVIALFLGNCILQYSVRNQSFWDQVYPADIQATIEANKAQMPNSWSKEKNRFECSEERVDDPKVQELNFGYGTCEVS